MRCDHLVVFRCFAFKHCGCLDTLQRVEEVQLPVKGADFFMRACNLWDGNQSRAHVQAQNQTQRNIKMAADSFTVTYDSLGRIHIITYLSARRLHSSTMRKGTAPPSSALNASVAKKCTTFAIDLNRNQDKLKVQGLDSWIIVFQRAGEINVQRTKQRKRLRAVCLFQATALAPAPPAPPLNPVPPPVPPTPVPTTPPSSAHAAIAKVPGWHCQSGNPITPADWRKVVDGRVLMPGNRITGRFMRISPAIPFLARHPSWNWPGR